MRSFFYTVSVLLLFSLTLVHKPVHAAQAGSQPLTPFDGSGLDFTLSDNKGQQYSLGDFTGKVVLINFWASWCPPCIYEMPELQKLQAHYSDRPFTVITINVGEKKYKIRKFTKLINFELPVLLDTTKATFDNWKLETLPTSFLVDKHGVIRYRVRGNPGWQETETLDIIGSLIDEGNTDKHDTE